MLITHYSHTRIPGNLIDRKKFDTGAQTKIFKGINGTRKEVFKEGGGGSEQGEKEEVEEGEAVTW